MIENGRISLLMVASTLLFGVIIASACNQPYSTPPSETNTPINSNSLFQTPLGQPTDLTDVQKLATASAIALNGTPAIGLETARPGSTSQPAAEAAAGQVGIAVLNLSSEVQSDGTIKNTADLSIDPLGLGSLHLTAPAKIKLGESRTISLSITPDSALVDLPKVTVATVSASEPGYVLEFSDQLQIYPVMIAELKGVNFDIVSDGNSERPVTSSRPVEWIWNVTPTSGGKQSLILVISIPVILDQAKNIVSAQALKNIPIEIEVEGVPTPSPLPANKRIQEQLIYNSTEIIVAILSLIGALVGAYVVYQNNKKSNSVSSAVKNKPKKR